MRLAEALAQLPPPERNAVKKSKRAGTAESESDNRRIMITIYLGGFLFNTYSQSDTAMWANSTSVKPWLVILHEPLPRRCSIIHLRQRPIQIILTGRSVTLVL